MDLRLKRRVALYAASVFPLGITARLTLSLAAVAVLAAAANMIARESVSIVGMVSSSPLRTMWNPGKSPAPIDVAARDAARFPALTLAVDRYERAVQLRSNQLSSTADLEYLA